MFKAQNRYNIFLHPRDRWFDLWSLTWLYSSRKLLTVSLPQTGDPEGPRHQPIVLLTTASSVLTSRPPHSSRKDFSFTIQRRSLVYDHVRYVIPGLKLRNLKHTKLSRPCFWYFFLSHFYNNGRDRSYLSSSFTNLLCFSVLIFYNNSFFAVTNTSLSIGYILSFRAILCTHEHCIWTSYESSKAWFLNEHLVLKWWEWLRLICWCLEMRDHFQHAHFSDYALYIRIFNFNMFTSFERLIEFKAVRLAQGIL